MARILRREPQHGTHGENTEPRRRARGWLDARLFALVNPRPFSVPSGSSPWPPCCGLDDKCFSKKSVTRRSNSSGRFFRNCAWPSSGSNHNSLGWPAAWYNRAPLSGETTSSAPPWSRNTGRGLIRAIQRFASIVPRVDADLALHPEENHRRERKRRQAGEERRRSFRPCRRSTRTRRRRRAPGYRGSATRTGWPARRPSRRRRGRCAQASTSGRDRRVLEPRVEIGHLANAEADDVAVAPVVRAHRQVEHGEAMPVQDLGHAEHRSAIVLVAVHGHHQRAAGRGDEPADEAGARPAS